jgi:hypothetical protein
MQGSVARQVVSLFSPFVMEIVVTKQNTAEPEKCIFFFLLEEGRGKYIKFGETFHQFGAFFCE